MSITKNKRNIHLNKNYNKGYDGSDKDYDADDEKDELSINIKSNSKNQWINTLTQYYQEGKLTLDQFQK